MANLLPLSAQLKTLKVAVTATASTSVNLPANGDQIRVVNFGPNIAYFSVGSGSQTATVPASSNPVATCTPILAGEDATFSIPNPLNSTISTPGTTATLLQFSAICDSTNSATLYISVGDGQ